jgi:RNA polymerase-binding transcription factor DksA
METKQAIRQRLEERLLYLQQRLHQVERDRRRETNPLDPDWQEQAITRQNDEVLDSLDSEGHREITAIQAALKRLQDGTYGDCQTCGGPIAPARLEALPYAVQCIACASQAEDKRR